LVTPAPNLAWCSLPARILVARCWVQGFVSDPLAVMGLAAALWSWEGILSGRPA
jgi:hypothetical protein